ncbi:MAG: ATP-binding protein [Polyangiaceae bacterium]|nr:ATP-binding protein [Polyangiaceae bacterium]
MALPFLDRTAELQRLRDALRDSRGGLVCVYGRRRLGKSRLIQRLCEGRRATFYTGDERDAVLQRRGLAREMERLIPGFARVEYPEWEALLERWWSAAPSGAPLVLDEFPSIALRSPELPSVLQKLLDERRGRVVIVCGSSQRMMQGLVLDRAAPLFGRAREIFRLEPLGAYWIRKAFRVKDDSLALEHHAVWGGVPRYWELARDSRGLWDGVRRHVLDPLGVLHDEPERLLLDETSDLARTASVLNVVARGSHRVSEIGARLMLPATTLSRPLARLVELGLLVREVPFDASARDGKVSLYRVGDPFLRFWFRFVDPNRSRLAAGQVEEVSTEIQREWPVFLGEAWESLVRESVPRATIAGKRWHPASRWWGRDASGTQLELDVVARSSESARELLVGEVKLRLSAKEVPRAFAELRDKTDRCPITRGKQVTHALWVLRPGAKLPGEELVLGPREVISVLR